MDKVSQEQAVALANTRVIDYLNKGVYRYHGIVLRTSEEMKSNPSALRKIDCEYDYWIVTYINIELHTEYTQHFRHVLVNATNGKVYTE